MPCVKAQILLKLHLCVRRRRGVLLLEENEVRVLDARSLEAVTRGVSRGRWP